MASLLLRCRRSNRRRPAPARVGAPVAPSSASTAPRPYLRLPLPLPKQRTMGLGLTARPSIPQPLARPYFSASPFFSSNSNSNSSPSSSWRQPSTPTTSSNNNNSTVAATTPMARPLPRAPPNCQNCCCPHLAAVEAAQGVGAAKAALPTATKKRGRKVTMRRRTKTTMMTTKATGMTTRPAARRARPGEAEDVVEGPTVRIATMGRGTEDLAAAGPTRRERLRIWNNGGEAA